MVSDLKESNPGKWHSKVKRTSGKNSEQTQNIQIDQLVGLSNQEQANIIASHYASISNQYEPVDKDDFPEYKENNPCPPVIEPLQDHKAILFMN